MKRFTLVMMAALCCLMSRAGGLTVDDLVGVYSVKATGSEYITDYSTATDMSTKSYSVEITRNDDGTMTINNLLGFGSQLTGTLNSEDLTITVAPGTVATYYTFASSTSATQSVVAEISGSDDSRKISFYDFDAWYSGYGYMGSGAEVVLTKTNISLEWSVEGTLTYNDDDKKADYHVARTTLSKYSGADDYDYILKFDYEYANPAEMKFKVAENGQISYANGFYSKETGTYYYYTYADNYCMFVYNGEYATLSGDKDGGEIYIWGEEYSATDFVRSGYISFMWGTKDGISSVAADDSFDASAPVYDLSGRKISKPSTGIYIQDGKKFFVK